MMRLQRPSLPSVLGASGHHVGVDIYGIHRIGHSHPCVGRKYVAYVSGVALGAVADEYLVGATSIPRLR